MASRAEIRDAVVELLKGHTSAGLRVGKSRARPVWRQGLPALQVYTSSEEFSISVEAPREYKVETDVAVELFVEETVDGPADDLVDALAREVFLVLSSDPTLQIDQLQLVPISFRTDFAASVKKPLGGARFLWRAIHYTDAPEGELGEMGLFVQAHVETDQAPVDGTREAIDDVFPDQ